jgi:hypothetical protein
MVGGKRFGDDDTSKDGVLIQMVINEVGGSSYPALYMTNYSDWALLMKVKLKVWTLCVKTSPEKQPSSCRRD